MAANHYMITIYGKTHFSFALYLAPFYTFYRFFFGTLTQECSMPRRSGISYYPSRNAYYTKINGRQICLAIGPEDGPCGDRPAGPTYRRATEEFYRLVNAELDQSGLMRLTVSRVVFRYYYFLKEEGRTKTLNMVQNLLDSAVRCFGELYVRELRPFHVSQWLASQAGWNSTSRRMAVDKLLTTLNWATSEGLIRENPIKDMKKPTELVRGPEVLIPPELFQLMLKVAGGALGQALTMLRTTGARPGEVVHAQSKHYVSAIGAIVFPWNPAAGEFLWKNAKRSKRDRIIYLTPALQSMVEDKIKRGATWLFSRWPDKAWSANNLASQLRHLVKRPAIRDWCQAHDFSTKRIMCYSFRHGYITDMLLKGCPIKLLADLCGTSVQMIEKNYSHAADDRKTMRQLFFRYNAEEVTETDGNRTNG